MIIYTLSLTLYLPPIHGASLHIQSILFTLSTLPWSTFNNLFCTQDLHKFPRTLQILSSRLHLPCAYPNNFALKNMLHSLFIVHLYVPRPTCPTKSPYSYSVVPYLWCDNWPESAPIMSRSYLPLQLCNLRLVLVFTSYHIFLHQGLTTRLKYFEKNIFLNTPFLMI